MSIKIPGVTDQVDKSGGQLLDFGFSQPASGKPAIVVPVITKPGATFTIDEVAEAPEPLPFQPTPDGIAEYTPRVIDTMADAKVWQEQVRDALETGHGPELIPGSLDKASLRTLANERTWAERKAEILAAGNDPVEPDEPVSMRKVVKLDPFQAAAVERGKQERFFCIVGPAGSGKSTCLHALLESWLESSRQRDPHSGGSEFRIGLASFTGRATQQMKINLDPKWHKYCDTIHGTLAYKPVYEGRIDKETGDYKEVRVFRPTYDAENKLPLKVLILDEAGMIPIGLWNELIAASRLDHVRILLLGDIQQLPPPIGRSVLGYAMNSWPVGALEKIHRTEENAIIETAHAILNGKKPRSHKGRVLIKELDRTGSTAFTQIVSGVKKMYDADAFDPAQDAIITGQNVGVLGQEALIKQLVHVFNPIQFEDGIPINRRHIIKAGINTVTFGEGDKVMLTQNIREQGLTNGQWGFVQRIWQNPAYGGIALEDIDVSNLTLDNVDMRGVSVYAGEDTEEMSERQASHCMEVLFHTAHGPETVIFQRAGEFTAVQLAYACTCHKMQGSEARNVIVVCHYAQVRMLKREWLYTAVTRAKEKLIILFDEKGMRKALRTQEIKGNTVKEKAEFFAKLMTEIDPADENKNNIPVIPDADEFVPDYETLPIMPLTEDERKANVETWARLNLVEPEEEETRSASRVPTSVVPTPTPTPTSVIPTSTDKPAPAIAPLSMPTPIRL